VFRYELVRQNQKWICSKKTNPNQGVLEREMGSFWQERSQVRMGVSPDNGSGEAGRRQEAAGVRFGLSAGGRRGRFAGVTKGSQSWLLH
jgi:hypothetical protein